MRTLRYPLFVLLVVACSSVGFGQAPDDDEPADLTKLPAPLEDISGNMLDFEKSGHFEIVDAQFGLAGIDNEKAIIWRLRAKRSITLRHVDALLNALRDVRFYRRGRNMGLPVFSTLLYYSSGIVSGAAGGAILPEGGTVKVWIYIDPSVIRRLQGAQADNVVFRHLKK